MRCEKEEPESGRIKENFFTTLRRKIEKEDNCTWSGKDQL